MTQTQYVERDGIYVAYQVHGSGPFDLALVPSLVTHMEIANENPIVRRFTDRLASFSRLITFDKRGTGLSDRPTGVPTLEDMMDDLGAVLDAVGCERAALIGEADGGPMCALFAATYPERTSALVLYGSYARRVWAPDYPWAFPPEFHDHVVNVYREKWGREPVGLRTGLPSLADDPSVREWYARAQRYGVSPGAAVAWYRMTTSIDIREILPAIRVPTLVMCRPASVMGSDDSRYLAEHIEGARYVELPGIDFFGPVGEPEAYLGEVEEFLTGSRTIVEPDRILATVLFTDIVGSTEAAARAGDRRWRDILDRHDRIVGGEIERHRGRSVKSTGDGVLAVFDGPARAIRCAQAIRGSMRAFDIQIRAGLHTGEIEVRGEDVGGIAVHIAARVAGMASPDEVLVSRTVKDLVVGSDIGFDHRGSHRLKGVPEEWQLFAVTGDMP